MKFFNVRSVGSEMSERFFIDVNRQKKLLFAVSLLVIVFISVYLFNDTKHERRRLIAFQNTRANTKFCQIVGHKRFNLLSGTDDPSLEVVKVEANTTLIKLDCPSVEHCDCDCCLLQHKLKNWPKEKPKAVIYFLSRNVRKKQMIRALQTLDKSFNDAYSYPVVIFHENETDSEEYRQIISTKSKSEIYFQQVEFSVPGFVKSTVSQVSNAKCGQAQSIGYRHMCRFQAFGVYEQPIIRDFEYGWRLDDDSELLSPIRFDIFHYMRNRNLKYGYLIIGFDDIDCIIGLWNAVRFYIKNYSVQTTDFFEAWKDGMIYYNNFEISAISFWLSDEYKKYFDFLDRQGGIYTHRWGDAPIKSIGVVMFANKSEVYHFNTIKYRHKWRHT